MKIRKELKELIESNSISADEYYFKKMTAPPLLSVIPYNAIAYLNYIASSIKFSGNINYKYEQIEKTVEQYGFIQIGRGTNRVAYRHLEDPRYVLKVAVDDVGIRDNPREFINQDYLYPFVTKIFEVDPTGTVALVERVEPIRHRVEFESIADKVFELLRYWFTGKYVMEDIGSEFFMNWGTRKFDGCPVLCDFPYMYELDYKKIYCTRPTPTGPCNGVIDYDDGYNRLICPKCGARYRAKELAHAEITNKIRIDKGERSMGMNRKLVVTVTHDGETKKVTMGNDRESVVSTRYKHAEQSSKKASYIAKMNLNNMIMEEKPYMISNQSLKMAEAIKKTQENKTNINQKIGEVIKNVHEEKKPAPPVTKEEPKKEEVKVEAPVKKPEPADEADYHETETVDLQKSLAESMAAQMMGNAIDDDKETKWDVHGNFIPKEEEAKEDEPEEDEPVDVIDDEDQEEETEHATEMPAYGLVDAAVGPEEGIMQIKEAVKLENALEYSDKYSSGNYDEEDDEPIIGKAVEIFGIYGLMIKELPDDFELIDDTYLYTLVGAEDDKNKVIGITEDMDYDNAAGYAILTVSLEFQNVSEIYYTVAENNDGKDCFVELGKELSINKFFEEVSDARKNGDEDTEDEKESNSEEKSDEYEMVDPPVGVVNPATDNESEG